MEVAILKKFRELFEKFTIVTGEYLEYRQNFDSNYIEWDDANQVFYAIRNNSLSHYNRADIECVVVPYASIVAIRIDMNKKEYLEKLDGKIIKDPKIVKGIKTDILDDIK